MSKAALYKGLSGGLMALGQGMGRAIETMTIEEMRQKNMRENWARQDKMRAEDRAERQANRAEDIAYRESRDKLATERWKIQQESAAEDRSATAEYRTKVLEGQQADKAATAEYRTKVLAEQAKALTERASQFDVGTLRDTLSDLDSALKDEVSALQDSGVFGENYIERVKQLRIENQQAKLAILQGARPEVIERAGLSGMRNSLTQWMESQQGGAEGGASSVVDNAVKEAGMFDDWIPKRDSFSASFPRTGGVFTATPFGGLMGDMFAPSGDDSADARRRYYTSDGRVVSEPSNSRAPKITTYPRY